MKKEKAAPMDICTPNDLFFRSIYKSYHTIKKRKKEKNRLRMEEKSIFCIDSSH